jgi:hypothetical protein
MKVAKDPTAGGYVLLVKSAEERKHDKEVASRPREIVKLKPFTPTGDEVNQITPGATGPTIAPRNKPKDGG